MCAARLRGQLDVGHTQFARLQAQLDAGTAQLEVPTLCLRRPNTLFGASGVRYPARMSDSRFSDADPTQVWGDGLFLTDTAPT